MRLCVSTTANTCAYGTRPTFQSVSSMSCHLLYPSSLSPTTNGWIPKLARVPIKSSPGPLPHETDPRKPPSKRPSPTDSAPKNSLPRALTSNRSCSLHVSGRTGEQEEHWVGSSRSRLDFSCPKTVRESRDLVATRGSGSGLSGGRDASERAWDAAASMGEKGSAWHGMG